MDSVSFFERCTKVGESALSFENPLVVHHIDCDGIASGATAAWALERSGKNVLTKAEKQLNPDIIAGVREFAQKNNCSGIVFTDFGSGMINEVGKLSDEFKVAVIDHHKLETAPSETIAHANCEEFGFSGTDDACGASTAYFCFRHRFPDLAQLGIVGAVGDMQDRRGFGKINALMLQDAISGGFCKVLKDLRMFGRNSRSLTSFLAYSSEPFVPGLSGDEKACALFLRENGLPTRDAKGNWIHYWDLPIEAKRALVGAFLNKCMEQKIDSELLCSIIGDVYVFPNEDPHSELYDALEYSTLLNACGRHGHAQEGIRLCTKKEGALEEGRKLLNEHRRAIRNGLWYARKNFVDLGAFYFLDCRGTVSDTVVGIVAGSFLGSGLVRRNKPAIAFALDEKNNVKASSRGTAEMVTDGLDLDAALRESLLEIGAGGGHSIAAGATIQKGYEDEFLKRLKKALEKQGFGIHNA
ncbi:TPA: DHH family phosphoesterase [Candidatus Micrarchaeota archaeon]|nr:DHH family phosphoesterase [Candidatus Micrarchaeota archaeon]